MERSERDRALAVAARQILVSKRALQQSFPRGLINDPAVEILLSLFVHDVDRVVMTDAELAAIVDCASASTFHRWLVVLESEKLTQRRPAGPGEQFVELTANGRANVIAALSNAAAAERRVRADPLRQFGAG